MDSMTSVGVHQKKQYNPIRITLRLLLIKLCSILVVSSLLFVWSCGLPAGAVPANAKNGRCPVCGMNVSTSDPWAGEIYYKDGTKVVFESPGDLLAFYTAPAEYKASPSQQDRSTIEKILVKDYQTRQLIDANQARLVYQSKVDGPMGADFLPFNNSSDAEAFVAANGGKIITLSEVTRKMATDLRKN